MDLQVRTDMVGATPVVALGGTADLGSVPALQGALARAITEHPGATVAVDLDGVTAVDDTALGVILGAAGRARSAGGDLVVVTTDERLRTRLTVTRFDRAVDVQARIAATTDTSVSSLSSVVEIYHAALPGDWAAALDAGVYATSTRGVSLDDEGFIHCSYLHQVEGVANRFYGDVTDLVLLRIDRQRLAAPVVDEPPAPGVSERFPHVYGPIPVDAVVDARPWRRDDDAHWRLRRAD